VDWSKLSRVGPKDLDPDRVAVWIRPSGAMYRADEQGGEGHPTSAMYLTGKDDETEAMHDVMQSGALRFSGYESEAGVTFTKTPTEAQVTMIRAVMRVHGIRNIAWEQVRCIPEPQYGTSRFVYVANGSDLRSLDRAARVDLPNPSLWQRIPADLDARIRSYDVRSGDVDDYYYHVTTATNARGVLAHGLRPGGGRSSMDEGFYRSYSQGKVFVTELGGVRFWMSRIEDHLESQGRWTPTAKLVILRALKSDIGDVEHDEFGSRDARAAAYKASRDLGRVEGRTKRTR